jgi:hypothetical protein
MRFSCLVGLLSLLLLLVPPNPRQATGQHVARENPHGAVPAHADTAWAYVGTVEEGRNCGPEVKMFLRSTGLGCGYPWCAAFVTYTLSVTGASYPSVRSAATRHFILDESIEARRVLRGGRDVGSGDLVVWRKGNTPYGHIGIVMAWEGRCGSTVEGNTSAGTSGHQRDGDGVWHRWRCIHPGSYFRITHFTRVRHE